MKNREIELDCLSELQAAKWFLMRERARHQEDIEQIDSDLKKLSGVDVPDKLLCLLDYHFEVPRKKKQTLFNKYKRISTEEMDKFIALQKANPIYKTLTDIVEGGE